MQCWFFVWPPIKAPKAKTDASSKRVHSKESKVKSHKIEWTRGVVGCNVGFLCGPPSRHPKPKRTQIEASKTDASSKRVHSKESKLKSHKIEWTRGLIGCNVGFLCGPRQGTQSQNGRKQRQAKLTQASKRTQASSGCTHRSQR
jgi:phage/plasmid-associated DNA primase